MLNADRLFQTLLTTIGSARGAGGVAADLDVDSIDDIPFITHSSQVTQDRNGSGLYSVNLTVSIFLAPADTPFDFVSDVYDDIQTWGTPAMTGIVPGVGAIESIDDEVAAFNRLTSDVQMLNKLVTQYVGSWQLTVRK